MSGQYVNGNTAIGNSALATAISNLGTIGHDNAAYGFEALKSLNAGKNESTAVGASALRGNSTGENTAVGAFSASNGDGTENTALGNWALRYGAGGNSNTAVGFRSIAGDEGTNTNPVTKPTGEKNTGVGAHTLRFSCDSDENTAVGYNALNKIEGDSSDFNTAIGSNALKNLTTGDSNSTLGRNTGATILNGNNNTLLGSASDVSDANAKYRTAVGAGSLATNDNTVILGRVGSDRVGVGTTTPNSVLHVVADSGSLAAIRAVGVNLRPAILADAVSNAPAIIATGASGAPTVTLFGDDDQSALAVFGGQKWKSRAFDDDYLVKVSDHVLIFTGTVAKTVTLPDPSSGPLLDGHTFIIRHSGTGGATLTVNVGLGGNNIVPYGSAYSAPVASVALDNAIAGSESRTFILTSYIAPGPVLFRSYHEIAH